MRYARGPLLTGAFNPVEILNPNIGWTDDAAIAFGEDGTGMILSCNEYRPPAPDLGAIVLNITRDDGLTWSPADTLTPYESAAYYWLDIWHWNHWWLACWIDTMRDPGFANWGLRCTFSPNNGRFWYPSQQIDGSGSYQVRGVCGELRPPWVRICMAGWYYLVRPNGYYFSEWDGQIHADSLAPSVSEVHLPPDTVAVGDTLIFSVTAVDNDTVFDVRLDIQCEQDSSWTVVMNRAPTDTFLASWRVPRAGRYRYQLAAEDLWENTSTYPTTGWATFVTEGWIDAVNDPSTFLAGSFTVTIFPNPFNSTTTISLNIPLATRHVTLTTFNLLGQVVREDRLPASVGQIVYHYDAAALASGIYLLRAEAGRFSSTQKIVLLR